MADADFIKNWLEGKISARELEERKLKGDITVHEYEQIISGSSRLKVPELQTQEQAWEKLNEKLKAVPQKSAQHVAMTRWLPLAIAASLAFITVSYFLLADKTIIARPGEKIVYLLPDGSEVFLNADSKIAFNEHNWNNERTIELEGEAFFQVKKGNRFTVKSEDATITVLGTSFNANVREDLFEVSCFTGKVSVVNAAGEVILENGKYTRIDNGNLSHPQVFNEKQKGTWRAGEFYFDARPLALVIDELERQFNVTIEYQGDVSRTYTGYFNTTKLDDALQMVFKPMSLKYHRQNPNKIIVE
jgi:transmembrane sensor